jgi:hypothetical protein
MMAGEATEDGEEIEAGTEDTVAVEDG